MAASGIRPGIPPPELIERGAPEKTARISDVWRGRIHSVDDLLVLGYGNLTETSGYNRPLGSCPANSIKVRVYQRFPLCRQLKLIGCGHAAPQLVENIQQEGHTDIPLLFRHG